MHNLIVRPVQNADEFTEAYNIALSVFAESTSLSGYADYKLFNWESDPYFNYQNILLARYNGESAGLIRIVPRKLLRGTCSFSVAGISSVCLLPQFRGLGLSVSLMEQTLVYCKEYRYEIAFLFARRAADHYYTRFGFYGIASYSRVFVDSSLRAAQLQLSVSEADDVLYTLYNNAYEKCYRDCFGRIERTPGYWEFIIKSIERRKDYRFYTIHHNEQPIGYLIAGQKNICEIAVETTISGEALTHLIVSNRLVECVNDKIEIEMLPQHALIDSFRGTDITLQSRECPYGGRMVKILDVEGVGKKLNKGNNLKESDLLSYTDTCSLLGVFSPTASQNEDRLPFDIGSIDHF
jgi:predicted acetyltransferase